MATWKRTFPLKASVVLLMLLLGACNLPARENPTSGAPASGATATFSPQAPLSGATASEATWTQTILSLPTVTPFVPTTTPTLAPVTMTAGQTLSCVTGPQWILYAWVASIPQGETVVLLARASPELEEYYYVRKPNSTECWAFGGSSVKSGNVSSLPVRDAPPLPTVTYTVEDQTGLAVCDLFIRDKDSAVWGAGRLGAGTILPSASFSLDLTAGYYDILIRDCAGQVFYSKEDWPIGSDPDYHHTVLHNEVDFPVTNDFAFDLCWFYFTPQGGASTLLHSNADGAVPPGGHVTFSLLVGIYELRILRCTGVLAVDIGAVYVGPQTMGFHVP